MSALITEAHRNKPAYVYVRQSTLAQVHHNQQSTERRYALQDKALSLGWQQQSVRILDRDLGQSGSQMSGREDFKTLVSDVAMGQVGAVFALEVSRLARSNLDWHRLLELCALTHTLVIDADGCYDPADFNDGLLLGLKGTMAQAELHFLRGRLQEGKVNKARKGDLRLPLPVGLCHDEMGRIVIDEQILNVLNAEGVPSAKGGPFTINAVRMIRYSNAMPTPHLQRPDEITIKELANELEVSPQFVRYWMKRGVIKARQIHRNGTYWITLNEQELQALRQQVRASRRIHRCD